MFEQNATNPARAAIKDNRTGMYGVGLLFGLLVLAFTGYARAACNYADLPFGFNVASISYSQSGVTTSSAPGGSSMLTQMFSPRGRSV